MLMAPALTKTKIVSAFSSRSTFVQAIRKRLSHVFSFLAEAPEDAQDLQVKNLKADIDALQMDLSQKSRETLRLQSLLKVALSKIHPDKVQDTVEENDEKLWQEYVDLQ